MLDGGKLVLGRKHNMKNSQSNGLFSSVVTEVLNEELGFSNEAYDEAVRLYNIINQLISTKSEYNYYLIDGIKVYGIKKEGSIEIFNKKHILDYRFEFIFINGNEIHKKLSNSIQIEFAGYDQNNNLLILRIPIWVSVFFNPETDEAEMDNNTASELYNTLQHEFKHIYQKYVLSQKDKNRNLLSFKNNIVYHKATEWIYANGYNGSDLSKMFWAIYQLEPAEITANLQGLFGEIKSKAKSKDDAINILNNSDFAEEIMIYSDILDKLTNNKIKLSDLFVVQRRLERNKEWITKYIRKGVSKMKQSYRKIEKLIEKEYQE
jgi:hypothetical protein